MGSSVAVRPHDAALPLLPGGSKVEVVLVKLSKDGKALRMDESLDLAVRHRQGFSSSELAGQPLEGVASGGEWVPKIDRSCFDGQGGAPLGHKCVNNTYVARGAPSSCVVRSRGYATSRSRRRSQGAAPINFKVGNENRSASWIHKGSFDEELGSIAVFDSHAAGVYITGKNEADFTPAGLDLLQKLATVCEKVRQQLQSEEASVEAQKLKLDGFDPSSSAGKLVHGLTSATRQEDVESLAVWSEEDDKNLLAITQTLAQLDAEDPGKRAAILRAQADRIDAFKKRVQGIEGNLGATSIANLTQLQSEAVGKARAAELASNAAFADLPLPQAGGDAWKALWEAARRFSEEQAYPGVDFPAVESPAVCVL